MRQEVVGVALQIVLALKQAAAFDIVHGDIKPSNILMPGDRTAKLSDFGLARLMSLGLSTRTGNGSWTFAYAAPELFERRLSSRSDQYSLAAAYVELRLNRPLFPGRDFVEAMLNHTEKTPDLAQRLLATALRANLQLGKIDRTEKVLDVLNKVREEGAAAG